MPSAQLTDQPGHTIHASLNSRLYDSTVIHRRVKPVVHRSASRVATFLLVLA